VPLFLAASRSKHTYGAAGVYKVIVKATDKNGDTAFLQLVGQATGAIQSNGKASGNVIVQKSVAWWPSLAMLPLIFAAFWTGHRHGIRAVHDEISKLS
jgi:hypothetical protein